MARPTPKTLRAAWWDPDESVTLHAYLSFLAGQRYQMRQRYMRAMGDIDSDEKLMRYTELLASNCLEIVADWTIRDPSIPYVEGTDRPILAREVATVCAVMDEDDLLHILSSGGYDPTKPQALVQGTVSSVPALVPEDESAPVPAEEPRDAEAGFLVDGALRPEHDGAASPAVLPTVRRRSA